MSNGNYPYAGGRKGKFREETVGVKAAIPALKNKYLISMY